MSRDTSENPLEILLNDGAAGCNRDPSRRSYLYNCTSFAFTVTAVAADYYLFAQISASIVDHRSSSRPFFCGSLDFCRIFD